MAYICEVIFHISGIVVFLHVEKKNTVVAMGQNVDMMMMLCLWWSECIQKEKGIQAIFQNVFECVDVAVQYISVPRMLKAYGKPQQQLQSCPLLWHELLRRQTSRWLHCRGWSCFR